MNSTEAARQQAKSDAAAGRPAPNLSGTSSAVRVAYDMERKAAGK